MSWFGWTDRREQGNLAFLPSPRVSHLPLFRRCSEPGTGRMVSEKRSTKLALVYAELAAMVHRLADAAKQIL
jgi:hypothetical protein